MLKREKKEEDLPATISRTDSVPGTVQDAGFKFRETLHLFDYLRCRAATCQGQEGHDNKEKAKYHLSTLRSSFSEGLDMSVCVQLKLCDIEMDKI